MNIDYGYLKLLPQPKVQKLAQKMSNQFNGKIVEGKNAIVENLKKEKTGNEEEINKILNNTCVN